MTAAPQVVVAGAGAAGLGAAISASRKGAKVTLIECRPRLGGTVAHALLHTIGGLYDGDGAIINPGLTSELVDRLMMADSGTAQRRIGRLWVLNASPEIYRSVVEDWIAAEAGIAFLPGCKAIAVEGKEDRPTFVTCRRGGEQLRLDADAFIDCTGFAELVRLFDPQLVEGDESDMLAGLILRIRNVSPGAIQFPGGVSLKRAIATAALAGELPESCATAWFDIGTEPDEAYLKLSVSTIPSLEEIDGIANGLMHFLARMPGFEHATLDAIGDVTPRSGRRALGEYRLTAADIRMLRRFPDMACRCAWPIEYWDPQLGVRMEYLRDNSWYEIPIRTLKVAGLQNVWVAGKCFSAEPIAQASARVAGCCWAMGEAAAIEAVKRSG